MNGSYARIHHTVAAPQAEPAQLTATERGVMAKALRRSVEVQAEPQSPSEAYSWQPIKTAPKDGTHILVWTDVSDTAYVVCWADTALGIRKYLTAESRAERGWHLAWDGELFDREHEPTHWMPLPDAPTAHEEQDLDAWECPDCGGAGRRTVYHSVTHQLGTDDLPFWEACETCDGIGCCGPDAEKLAALSKPPVQHTDAAPQAEPQPIGFMSRATYSTSSGAGYKQITFRFTELDDANQIRLWAMSYGAKAANHVVPQPEREREPLSREQIEALPVWSPFVGLWPQSRQEIARAIEAAHGIGTKGGE